MRWSMPRIHAGRSQRSRAKPSAAMTMAAAPSVIGGQSERAQRVDDGLLAEVVLDCDDPRRAAPWGWPRPFLRLRVATSAMPASSIVPASSAARAWRAAMLMASGHSGATLYGIELARQHLVDRPGRGLAVAVDERAVDLAELQLHPRLVEREGAVHLDVALLDGRPRADAVEGHHEAEPDAGEVVGRPRAGEPDVVLGDLAPGSRTSSRTGMSISTSLRCCSLRTWSVWAKPMIADVPHRSNTPSPRNSGLSSQRGRSSPGMWISTSGSPVGRNHLIDSMRRAEVGVVDPDGLDPHAGPNPVDGAFLDEVHDRQVGAVELDERRHVGQLHRPAVERHVHDAEARDRAGVGHLDRLGRRHAELRVGASGWDVDPGAGPGPLAEDPALRRCPGGSGCWHRRACT